MWTIFCPEYRQASTCCHLPDDKGGIKRNVNIISNTYLFHVLLLTMMLNRFKGKPDHWCYPCDIVFAWKQDAAYHTRICGKTKDELRTM